MSHSWKHVLELLLVACCEENPTCLGASNIAVEIAPEYLDILAILIWLVVGTLTFFSHHIGNVIIPAVTHSIIFQRGRSTTNQLIIYYMEKKMVTNHNMDSTITHH